MAPPVPGGSTAAGRPRTMRSASAKARYAVFRVRRIPTTAQGACRAAPPLRPRNSLTGSALQVWPWRPSSPLDGSPVLAVADLARLRRGFLQLGRDLLHIR